MQYYVTCFLAQLWASKGLRRELRLRKCYVSEHFRFPASIEDSVMASALFTAIRERQLAEVESVVKSRDTSILSEHEKGFIDFVDCKLVSFSTASIEMWCIYEVSPFWKCG